MKNLFELVNLWDGFPCLIVGGGRSVLDFNKDFLKDFKTIGVNNAALDFNTDALWFSDDRWLGWADNMLKILHYEGIKVGCPHEDYFWLYKYKRCRPTGIETSPEKICWNNNSGGGAINFAYHLGSRIIGLVGYDMCLGEAGEFNYHNKHKVEQRHKNYNFFSLMILAFQEIQKDAIKLGVEIYNLNERSKLDVFPKISIQQFVEKYRR